MQPESLSEALRRVSKRGFTHALRAEHGALRDLATGETHDPELLEIDEMVRFEGESDPDEQAVLFAVRSARGTPLGTYSAVFGAAMPPEDGEVVRKLGSKC
jgi:hypothetical protein